MFREKYESGCKDNELFLDCNMGKKKNLYLHHMPPAVEALGKMVILAVVKLQDQLGQRTNANRVLYQGWLFPCVGVE